MVVQQWYSGTMVVQWWYNVGIVVVQLYSGVTLVQWWYNGTVVVQWYSGGAVVQWYSGGTGMDRGMKGMDTKMDGGMRRVRHASSRIFPCIFSYPNLNPNPQN